jgi:hypothetical protein
MIDRLIRLGNLELLLPSSRRYRHCGRRLDTVDLTRRREYHVRGPGSVRTLRFDLRSSEELDSSIWGL